MKRQKYKIIYDSEVYNHLKYIDKKYWNLIEDKISGQLLYEPIIQTKNKKPLTNPPIDDRWELRFGPKNSIRVFYKVIEDEHEVWILAIGTKIKEKLFIAGKEIIL